MTNTPKPASAPGTAPARWALDDALASLALACMAVIPAIEVALRPLLGRGIDNAPVLVQHLGLVLAMAGALAAERHGHLTTLGSTLPKFVGAAWQQRLQHLIPSWGQSLGADPALLACVRERSNALLGLQT